MKNICRTKGARKGQMPGYVKTYFDTEKLQSSAKLVSRKVTEDFMCKSDASDTKH